MENESGKIAEGEEDIGEETAPPVLDPSASQCQHMVLRKKRLCRMTVRPGRSYCGEHDRQGSAIVTSESGAPTTVGIDTRIPCPLDPKHTCYASKLEKHLTVCNARRDSSPPYVRRGCNSSGAVGAAAGAEGEQRVRLKDVAEDKLRAVINLVETLYTELVHDSILCQVEGEDEPVHPAVLEDYQLEERGRNTLRHLRQSSSLLRRVERAGLVRPATCYVELGAGKGHVSYYLSRAVRDTPSCSVLLVDRASHRHKQDNKLDRSRHRVSRIRADIGDLVLAEVEAVRAASSVVAVSKHLCGAATDYALRCATAPGVRGKTRGVVLATCCHHRCARAAYVGRDLLAKCGITQEYFDIMMGVVSWATCGSGYSRERRREEQHSARKRQKTQADDTAEGDSDEARKLLEETVTQNNFNNSNTGKEIIESEEKLPENKRNVEDTRESFDGEGARKFPEETVPQNDFNNGNTAKEIIESEEKLPENKKNSEDSIDGNNADDLNSSATSIDDAKLTDVRLGLTVERRTEIGRRAKALLDYGRVEYLRGCGFDAHLCYYVDVSCSPENVCIVAKK